MSKVIVIVAVGCAFIIIVAFTILFVYTLVEAT